MSEQSNNTVTTEEARDGATTTANPMDELAVLKERALTLGIQFHPSIGVEKLRAKVNARLTGAPEDEDEAKAETKTTEPNAVVPLVRAKTRAEKEADLRAAVVKDAMALVRCRIYNLNPQKRDLKGELITVANKFVGKVSKFIPFGEESEEGYHIPQILFDDLKARQYQDIRTKEKNGKIEVIRRMVPEYNLVVLDPMSPEELQELAMKQEAANRVLGA